MEGGSATKATMPYRAVFPFLGMALLLSCTWCSDFSFAAPTRADATVLFYLPRVCTIVALACCALRPERLCLRARGSLVPAFLGACAGAGRLLGACAGMLPAGEALSYLGVTMYGVAEAVLLVLWLARCCALEPRQTRIVFPLAYLLVACVYFVLMVLDPVIVLALLALFPVASGLLLGSVAGEGLDGSGEPGAGDEEAPVAWTFPFLPVALMVVYKLIFYFSLSLTDGPSLYGPLGIIVITLVALVATWFFFDRYSASLLYRLALPLMVGGLLLLAWLHAGSMVATLLTNASNIGFELFILITLAEICFKYRIDGIWMFSIVQTAQVAASTLGWCLGEAFAAANPVGSPHASAVVAAIVVALIALSMLFFNDRLVSKTFGTEPVGAGGSGSRAAGATMSHYEELVWRCARVARRYGLTHREEEVLELLSQGMSTARIEEDLCISNSTAKTHIRHLYEKMGVHSRDEARKIVEAD